MTTTNQKNKTGEQTNKFCEDRLPRGNPQINFFRGVPKQI